jgi:hypothetical protein
MIQIAFNGGKVGIGLIDNLGNIRTISANPQDLKDDLVFAPARSNLSIPPGRFFEI